MNPDATSDENEMPTEKVHDVESQDLPCLVQAGDELKEKSDETVPTFC